MHFRSYGNWERVIVQVKCERIPHSLFYGYLPYLLDSTIVQQTFFWPAGYVSLGRSEANFVVSSLSLAAHKRKASEEYVGWLVEGRGSRKGCAAQTAFSYANYVVVLVSLLVVF